MDFVLEALQKGGETFVVNPRHPKSKLLKGGPKFMSANCLRWGLGGAGLDRQMTRRARLSVLSSEHAFW
eukprot:3638322-Amphidinium_carterae.1